VAVPLSVRVPLVALISALLFGPGPAAAADDEGPRVDAVALAAGLGQDDAANRDALLRFYASRDYKPAWTRGHRLSRQGAALLRVLREADREGLPAGRYWPSASEAAGDDDAAAIGQLDLRLTGALLRYAADVGQGRFDPAAVNPYWAQRTAGVDAGAILSAAVDSKDVEKTLGGLLPRNPQYAALREALARYRGIAAKGGWPTAPPFRTTLKPGRRAPEVAVLRTRLIAEGDLRGSVPAGKADLFDLPLSAALKRFQLRHGLEPSGAADRASVVALSVAVEERVRQIELNLERWRWLSPSLGGSDRFVLVNIPAFELYGFDGGRPVLRMRVVTGSAARSPTPVFGRAMTHVVFRPYWNVPTSIAQDEIMPAVYRDSGYLRRRNMELVRGDGGVQLRQRPGPGNALGLVKFLLPNPFGVYLHDTPEDGLFARARRDRSHGCVRVERPFDLARFALQDAPEWTPARIRAAAARGPEQPVALPEPLPVYVTYLTVWADADGVTRFYPDVYEHDAAQEQLLH
jgi:murein L,D-transpeptidase YcbB/YkuD